MTTQNAILGQGVEEITPLYDRYSEEELYALAADRTAKSKTATFGFTQQLSDKYQMTADLTVSSLESTIASGGVDAQPATGTDYYFSSQLVASNFFMDADIFTAGIQYADTQRNQTYSLIFNSRLPLSQRLRINPRLRLDYRTSKDSTDQRIMIRPYLRVDYRVRNWMQLELELGVEFLDQEIVDQSDSSTGVYMFAGYRIDF